MRCRPATVVELADADADGEHHDLIDILDDIGLRYFAGTELPRIVWGRRSGRRGKWIRVGSYDPEGPAIIVSPELDRIEVPRFYVESVVHHELVHHHLGAAVRNGRCFWHTAAFRALERTFEHHDRAVAWEGANLGRVLRG